MENNIIIKTYDLSKSFGSNVALKDLNLTIEKGSVYGLIGRNGAGKTTFLNLAASLIYPTKGELIIKPNLKFGVLIEEPGLYPQFDAYFNLKAKALCLGYNYNKDQINKLINFVGLKAAKKRKIRTYSLGMRQRLGIALALLGNPDVLILDEPINGLDPQGIREVRDIITKVSQERNTTVLISSHILDELAKICTDFCFIDKGQVVATKTKDNITEECKDMTLEDYYFKLLGGEK